MNTDSRLWKPILITMVVILFVIVVISFTKIDTHPKEERAEETKYNIEEIIEEEQMEIPEEETPKKEKAAEKEIKSEEETQPIKEAIIEIKNLRFHPEEIIISPGTNVTWINKDNVPHKVVAYDRLFYGKKIYPGESYSFTFTKPGTHRYFDAVFVKIGRGKIIVKEEPLPITGSVIGIFPTSKDKAYGIFLLAFVIMILSVSRIIHHHYKT